MFVSQGNTHYKAYLRLKFLQYFSATTKIFQGVALLHLQGEVNLHLGTMLHYYQICTLKQEPARVICEV
jgi:hypothetical protein